MRRCRLPALLLPLSGRKLLQSRVCSASRASMSSFCATSAARPLALMATESRGVTRQQHAMFSSPFTCAPVEGCLAHSPKVCKESENRLYLVDEKPSWACCRLTSRRLEHDQKLQHHHEIMKRAKIIFVCLHLVFGGAPAKHVAPDVSLLQAAVHLFNLPQRHHNLSDEVVCAHVPLAVDGDLQPRYPLFFLYPLCHTAYVCGPSNTLCLPLTS